MRWYMALAFVLAVQMFMFLGQSAIDGIGGNPTINTNNYYQQYDNGNLTLKTNLNQFLPTASGSVDVDTGALYTDSYQTGSKWVTEDSKNTNFLTAPYDIIKSSGFGANEDGSNPLAYAFSVFWYVLLGSLILYQFLRGGA